MTATYCRTCRDWQPGEGACPYCGDSRRGYAPVTLLSYGADSERSDPQQAHRVPAGY